MKKGCLVFVAVLAPSHLGALGILEGVAPTSLFSHVLLHNYEKDGQGKETAVYQVSDSQDFMRLISESICPVVFRFISRGELDVLQSAIWQMSAELDGRVLFASVNLEKSSDLGRDLSQMILSFVAQLQASGSQAIQLIPMLVYTAQQLAHFQKMSKPLFLYAHRGALVFPSSLHFESAQNLYDDINKKFLGRIVNSNEQQSDSKGGLFERVKAWFSR